MRPRVVEVLTAAIAGRQPVRLEYRHSGQGLRTVHPHALYPGPHGLVCDVYQVAGYTSAGRTLPGWRALDLAQIVRAESLPGRFPVAPGYNPDAERYRGGLTAPE